MDLLSKDNLGTQLEQNNEVLRRAVEEIYYGNNLELSSKPVKTIAIQADNNELLNLRVKHFNAEYSDKYKEAFGICNTPLVLGPGLYGYLETFEKGCAQKATKDGQDVWLLEIRNFRLYLNFITPHGKLISESYGAYYRGDDYINGQDFTQDIVVPNKDISEISLLISSDYELNELKAISDLFHGRTTSVEMREDLKEVLER